MAKTKQRNTEPQPLRHINAACVMNSGDIWIPTADTAFDIETGPLDSDQADSALLDPQTAQIVAIGYYQPSEGIYRIAYDSEADMLRQFWHVFMEANGAGVKLIGFNIFGFDLPFIVRRSWLHGVKVPKTIMIMGGRYWCDTFVDLMQQWKCGSYKDFISLDALARYLGVGHKTGSGEKFYALWEKDREAAIDYLANDVKLVIDCAVPMGVTHSVA